MVFCPLVDKNNIKRRKVKLTYLKIHIIKSNVPNSKGLIFEKVRVQISCRVNLQGKNKIKLKSQYLA